MQLTLIIGDEDEPQTHKFAEYLRRQGYDVHCFLVTDFPDKLGVSWSPDCGQGKLHLGKLECRFESIKSIYWHRTEPMPNGNHTEQSTWLKKERFSALSPLFHCNGIRWVNSFSAIQYHLNKPRQLNHAVRLGATIPPTYIGNSVEEADSFLSNHKQCIYKPVQGGTTTKVVTKAHRNKAHLAQALSKAPITLQARVGVTNVRSYVIGNQIFSAELATEAVDFRDDAATDAKVIDLPFPERDLARRLCRGFGMEWCAIDWRRDEAGQYYFLEANPCPYFIHFENVTSLPISRELGHLLVH